MTKTEDANIAAKFFKKKSAILGTLGEIGTFGNMGTEIKVYVKNKRERWGLK
jgi:hypothetical protein